MKIFELNKETLQKGWGGENQYWFSLQTYRIKEESSLVDIEQPDSVSQSEFFLSLGYIPYFFVSNEEVLRAYSNSIENKKLKAALQNIDSKNFADSFWKYINAYPELSENLRAFEDDYVLQKAKDWCDENSINYVVNF